MFGIRIVRKFVKFVRGGAMPWQVAASCMLGVCIGMVPGFNMTVVILALLFVLLNLNLGLMLVGLLLGKALCLTLAPVTYRIGHAVIHSAEGLFRGLSQAPILAWMDLHVYSLIGGIPIALIVGGVIGVILGRLIATIRGAIVAGGEKSERFQKLSKNIVVRIVMRLLFGKQKKGMAEMLGQQPPMFRKAGVIVCVVLVVLVLVGQIVFADMTARAGLVRGLQAATGAEVNVADVSFSPLTGRLEVAGLQVTDPNNPTHNMIQIEKLTSDMSVGQLLSRRFVMDEVIVTRLQTDAKRQSPGEVFVEPEKPEPSPEDAALDKYFKSGRRIFDYMRRIKKHLDGKAEQQEEGRTPEQQRRLAERQGYLRMSARDLLARRPALTITRLVIEEIPAGSDTYHLEGQQVSESPRLTAEPMILVVTSSLAASVAVTHNFSEPGAVPQLKMGSVKDVISDAVNILDRVQSGSDGDDGDGKDSAVDRVRGLFDR